VEACERWKLPAPEHYAENFRDETSGLAGVGQFLLSVADASIDAVGGELLDKCDQIGTHAGIPLQDNTEVAQIVYAFEKLIPGTGATSLCSVANAGWKVFHDASFWSRYPHIRNRKTIVLNELLLKTVEIFEVEARLRGE